MGFYKREINGVCVCVRFNKLTEQTFANYFSPPYKTNVYTSLYFC